MVLLPLTLPLKCLRSSNLEENDNVSEKPEVEIVLFYEIKVYKYSI